MYNQAIYELLKQSIDDQAISGVSYSLLGQGINEQNYLGMTDHEHHLPLTPDLEYDLASLTKVIVVATRCLTLLSEKKIVLSDPIGDYVTNTVYPTLTIQQLLLHDSGLPADVANPLSYQTRAALIDAIKKTAPITPAGGVTRYSDLNFILLGWLIEAVDQKSLADDAQETLFKPLGMQHTGYLLDLTPDCFVPTEYKTSRGGQIQGEVHDETAFRLGGISGNAGLFSTLQDLNLFVKMLLNNGIVNGQQLLPPQAFSLLHQYHKNGRTLGWQVWSPNHDWFWHTGFTGTSIAFDLEQKRAFVCLTNRICPTRDNRQWLAVRRLAIGLFYGKPEVIQNDRA